MQADAKLHDPHLCIEILLILGAEGVWRYKLAEVWSGRLLQPPHSFISAKQQKWLL
jgi:hypothetical protein